MISFLNTFSKLMVGSIAAYFIVALRESDTDYVLSGLFLAAFLGVVWALYGIYRWGVRHGERGSDT